MSVPKTYILLAFALSIFTTVHAQQIRSVDGIGNNQKNPGYGASHQPVQVMTSLDYGNGVNSPSGWNRANARTVSNELFSSVQNKADEHGLTNLVWAFGKFIEHDITYFQDDDEAKVYVKVPQCDDFLDPTCSGSQNLVFKRLKSIQGTGDNPNNPRNVANLSTAWIDGSPIYGSDSLTANWLRTGVDGKLKVSQGNMLPFNTISGEMNGPSDPNAPAINTEIPGVSRYFSTGDPRANENLVILGFHTLFVREHNRICSELKIETPGLSDELLYQKARSILVGILQNIVFNEWLPTIGIDLGKYRGYNPNINPNISNEFCAAGFKIWHTLQTDEIALLDDHCKPFRLGSVKFNDLMYNPLLIEQTNLSPIFKGLASRRQLNMDYEVIDAIRNFDYEKNGLNIKSDLIARDIIRGRERGIPDYNTLRRQLGLAPIESFAELTKDKDIQAKLTKVYNNDINNIDPWVGLVAEDHFPRSMVGETMSLLLTDQFSRLRRGDRFYFENDPMLSEQDRNQIRQTTFSDVILRNTDLTFLQDDVFKYDPQCLEIAIKENHLNGQVFPNPVIDAMDLSIYSRKEGKANMMVFNTLGDRVDQSYIDLKPGMNLLHCTVDKNLSAGLYIIRIIQDQSAGVIKFIKSN